MNELSTEFKPDEKKFFTTYDRFRGEPGYYWVKITGCSDWSIARYMGNYSWNVGASVFGQMNISLINGGRILNPDEK